MSPLDREKLWVAYLDGQLSASETVAFEASLTEVERAQAAQELLLERRISESFQDASPCPESLWQGLTAQCSASPLPKHSFLGSPRVLVGAVTSLAAVLVLTFGLGQGIWPQRPVEPILALTADLPQFENQSSTPGELQAVQQFMRERHVQLVMNDVTGLGARHPVRLVGASEQGCHGKSVMEIRFECCNKPVKVVLASYDTKAASIILEGNKNGSVSHIRKIGTYIVGVVSKHPAPDLTQLFQPPAAVTGHSA